MNQLSDLTRDDMASFAEAVGLNAEEWKVADWIAAPGGGIVFPNEGLDVLLEPASAGVGKQGRRFKDVLGEEFSFCGSKWVVTQALVSYPADWPDNSKFTLEISAMRTSQ